MERIIQKASELLKRCQAVTFATVNGEGFPRPVPVKTLRTDDALTIWFATGIDSEKVAHIRRNMRTGASFYDRDDSVTCGSRGWRRISPAGRPMRIIV